MQPVLLALAEVLVVLLALAEVLVGGRGAGAGADTGAGAGAGQVQVSSEGFLVLVQCCLLLARRRSRQHGLMDAEVQSKEEEQLFYISSLCVCVLELMRLRGVESITRQLVRS